MHITCQLILSCVLLVTMTTPSLRKEAEVANIADANTDFNFDLLRTHGEKDTNLFISPFSISTALALTLLGAEGDTAKEMRNVLRWSPSLDVTKGFGSYLPLLKQPGGEGYVLAAAQRVYVRTDIKLKPEFKDNARKRFSSDAQNADFRGNAEQERQVMNSWVSEQTRGKINDLLAPGSINELTAMVLIQATYFKGKWADPFDPADTKPADFYTPQGTVQVDMMRMKRDMKYGQSSELKCQAVELPYLNNQEGRYGHDLTMLILLPDHRDGLQSLEQQLSRDVLTKLRNQLYFIEVDLQLPRFKLESSLQLSGPLQHLGMPLAFSDAADFSGMTEGGSQLFISEIYHKAVLEVNEEGSEAAAATGIICCDSASSMPVDFVVDHPFLVFIIDDRAKMVLFYGRFVQP